MSSKKPTKSKDEMPSKSEEKMDGDISQSVIIAGNNNVVNVEKKESKRTSSKKRAQKTKKISSLIVVAIIGAIATLFAALISILPEITERTPVPTATFTNMATFTLPPPSNTSTMTSIPTPTLNSLGCAPYADVLFDYVLSQSNEIVSALGNQTRDHSRCVQSSYQSFEGGEMIWRSGDPDVYVLYANHEWEAYKNNFVYNTEVPCNAGPIPSRMYQPLLGFGKIWCEDQSVKERLGYATLGEKSDDRAILTFENGWLMLMDYTVRAVFYDQRQWEGIDIFDFKQIPLDSRTDLDTKIGNLGLEQEQTITLPQAPLTMRDPDTGKLLVVPFRVGSKISTQCDDKAEHPETIQIPANIPHPVRVYILIQAGWGVRSYEYRPIGNVSLKFNDGNPLDTSLILGFNIRDWADRPSVAITTLDSPYTQTALEGFDEGVHGRIDILIIDIPEIYVSSALTEIQIDDLSRLYADGLDPCIHLSAVTVEYLQLP